MWIQIFVSFTIAGYVSAQDLQQCVQCVHQNQMWCVDTGSCQEKSVPCKTNITLSLNCPRLPDPAYAYNDTFARYYIYPLIGALFGETPVPCLKAQLPYVSYYKTITVKCSDLLPNVTCHGYTAWDPVEKAIIIVYHGTSSKTEKIDETASLYEKKVAFFEDGHLFKYFHDAFMFIWAGALEQQVRTLKYLYPDYNVIVTGHSTGAALAGVTAAYLVKWNFWLPQNLRLITLGQPRTGDYDFAEWHDSTVISCFALFEKVALFE
ncbi:triacylglycerol lipase [Cooperia oncophora]